MSTTNETDNQKFQDDSVSSNDPQASQLIAVLIQQPKQEVPQLEMPNMFLAKNKIIHKQKLQSSQSNIIKSTRRARRKRLCWYEMNPAAIFRPIKENIYFRLSGDISLFLQKIDEDQYPQHRIITEVEDNGSFFCLQCFSGACLVDFQFVIYLLENSQNKQKYVIAQYLKVFQDFSFQAKTRIDELQIEYKDSKEEYENIIFARNNFKKQIMKEYFQNSLRSDEFCILIEQSANFRLHQLSAKQLFISKSIFALIGLEEDQIATHLLHHGIGNQTLLSDRDNFFLSIMEAYCSQSKEFIRCKNFKLVTLDGIHVHCEALLLPIYFKFPSELQFKRSHLNSNIAESFLVIKYDIKIEHIKLVLGHRRQMALTDNETNSSDLDISYKPQTYYTLDYQFLSSLFKDTFYPNQK